MLRWIQTSVYLPLMRVHGYMSNTEPWQYGADTQAAIARCLRQRYQLLPYIYSNAAAVSFEGGTLMRPFVFDFSHDPEALQQRHEYMFGPALLVSPVTEDGVTIWPTYLPRNQAGWYDLATGLHYPGGQTVTTDAADHIPVFARGGSILPLALDGDASPGDATGSALDLHIYPGADATFTLYEDDGTTLDYEQGRCSRITFVWDDAKRRLTIGKREGHFAGMPATRQIRVSVQAGNTTTLTYQGKKLTLTL